MPDTADAPLARSGSSNSEAWANLAPGDPLTVVKLAPDGSEAARYQGTVSSRADAEGWVIVQAVWTYRHIEVEGLTFSPGDLLSEWFSPRHDFNAFAVHAANGAFKGWYANVTYPARLDAETVPPTLTWHDLYVDVVGLPGGARIVCDEDELAASGLEQSDPGLLRQILRARDQILRRHDHRLPPFRTGPKPAS